jgi:hypothetical protein
MTKKQPDLPEWQREDAARLKRLFDAPSNKLGQLAFGQTYGVGSQGMVWQYLHAHRPLNITAAVAFAKGLDCKVEDFSPTLAQQIASASEHSGTNPVSGPDPEHLLDEALNILRIYRRLPADQRLSLLGFAQDLDAEFVGANESAINGGQAQR